MNFNILDNYNIIADFYKKIKSNKQQIYSNLYKNNNWFYEEINKNNLKYNIQNDCLLLLHKQIDFYKLYYITSSLEDLSNTLNNINIQDILISEIIDKNDVFLNIRDIFLDNKFTLQNTLINLSKKINKNDINININSNVIYPTYDNINEISNLHKLIFDKYTDNFLTKEEIYQLIDNKQILIIKLDDKISGYIIFDIKNSVSQLKYWAVDKRISLKGTGNSLFYSMCNLMNENSILECWCKEDNKNALSIYRNKGFSDTNKKCYILSLNLNN